MAEQSNERADGQWTGRWCWTRKHMARPWNRYAYFRREVRISGEPRSAIVRISADARYALYVNGRRIHQGPARSNPAYQSYDVLDLADALEPGKNAICAIVHQFGVPTFQSVYRDASGLLLDGQIEVAGQSIDISTPSQWVCKEATAWRQNTARLSVQLGFQEHFDADAEEAAWMSPNFEPKSENGWKDPFNIGPVGVHPWMKMEHRGVPLLAERIEDFQAVLAQFTGENARGYKIAEDVYHLALQETRKKEKNLLVNPQAMLRDDAELTSVNAPAEGQFGMITLDLGRIKAGHVMLDIADAAGDEIIDILYSEECDKAGAPVLLGTPNIGICEEATADRYRCRPGAQQWEPFCFKGMRYVTLIFRNMTRPLKIRRVALRRISASLEELGSFECSDPVLNQIWNVGRETLRNCMFDAYVDCPWREQAQWWGDARVQFRVNAYTFGDVSLLERGIRQVAQSQTMDGSLQAVAPSDTPLHRLPDYMLTWVGTLWDYYFHTGRTELLRESLPTMLRLFEFFAAHEKQEGLIGGFDGFWVFLDGAPLYRDDFSAVLNLMYLQALRSAAAILYVLDEESAADVFHAKAAALEEAVEKYFWDPRHKVWRDGWDPKTGRIVEESSQHTNALAMLLHLKSEAHPTLAKDLLLKPAGSRRGKVITASPFFYAWILEALAESNFRTELVGVIREKWGQMIERGATTFWEVWDPTRQSRCHGWSASPVYHLSQQVLGVSPVDIGWRQVKIAPLPGELEYARGRVPTPLGPISVEWEKAGEDQLAVRIELPQGMEGEFIGPLGETRILEAGVHEFHT